MTDLKRVGLSVVVLSRRTCRSVMKLTDSSENAGLCQIPYIFQKI
jgi:hypothetical protein